jgi:hypothetical protein
MQLTCVVDKEILCTDNDSLAQLLNVPSCERVFSHQDGAGVVSPSQQRLLN